MKRAFVVVCIVFSAACAFAQSSFSVFGLDASGFPQLKAKFYAFDANGQQVNPSAYDITVTEDGTPRTITAITCPPKQPTKRLSSVLVMDVSGSMSGANIGIAKNVANVWVNGLPLGQSECALASFDDANYLNQDFTTDKKRLLSAIDYLHAQGGTDYDQGLLLPMSSGLQISKTGKYQKVIIFLTDGMPNSTPQQNAIIAEAKSQGCVIYAVTVGLSCPQVLKDISNQTGGTWFENIVTQQQAEDVYRQILHLAMNGAESCEMTWQSGVSCTEGNRNVSFGWNGLTSDLSYPVPTSALAKLIYDPLSLFFRSKQIGVKFDTTITITASNSPFTVSNITSSNSEYDISPKNFSLLAGESKTITVSYTPFDSSYTWTTFDILNDLCAQRYYASGGYPGVKPKIRDLKLEKPNGGEVFVVGGDTTISWSGIPLTDTVKLEYSTDGGNSWNLINNKATGGKYLWHVPRILSDKCLVKVTQLTSAADRGWARSAGGVLYDGSADIATDVSNNIYITGWFKGTMHFGSDSIKSDTGTGFFICKYNPDGSSDWVRSATGNYTILAGQGIAIDSFGNVYATGVFEQTMRFSGLTLNGSMSGNTFIVKYHTDGTIEWAKSVGGYYNQGNAIAVSRAGEIYVAGSFTDTVYFDGIKLVCEWGHKDLFLAKYLSDGSLEWVRHANVNTGFDPLVSVTVDMANDVYISGNFVQNADFDGTLLSASQFDQYSFYIAKYDQNGIIQWAKKGISKGQGGSQTGCYGTGLSSDLIGNIYVSGTYNKEINLDQIVLKSRGGYKAAFLAKYHPDGSMEWASSVGSLLSNSGRDVSVDAFGNPCITGYIEGTSDFGGVVLNNNSGNIYVARYKPNGSMEWAKRAGGIGDAGSSGITFDRTGAIYITGSFSSSSNFYYDTLTTAGSSDVFVWKIPANSFQSDTSDAVFSIVMPQYVSNDIDMRQVLVGKAKDSLVSSFIRNTGTYPFRVDSLWFAGADASDFSLVSGIPPFVVPAGGSRAVEFRFKPSAVGIRQAQIVIKTQADTLRQNIQGEGISPQITVIGNVIDFGEVGIGAFKDTTITVAIQNTGNVAVNFSGDAQIGPDMKQFSVTSGAGAFTLAPSESRTLTLRFAPQFIGRTSGRVAFDFKGTGSPAIISLFGTGLGGLVYVPDDSAAPGEHISLPLKLGGKIELRNIQSLGAVKFRASLTFNSSMLVPEGQTVQDVIANGERTITITQAWDGASDTLAMIPFIAALGEKENTSIDIPSFEWLDASGNPVALDVETQSGLYSTAGLCREGGTRLMTTRGTLSMSYARPNPTSRLTTIDYELIEDGPTKLFIADVLGRTAAELAHADMKAGKYSAQFDASNFADGMYYYILQTPTQRLTKKLMIAQ